MQCDKHHAGREGSEGGAARSRGGQVSRQQEKGLEKGSEKAQLSCSLKGEPH